MMIEAVLCSNQSDLDLLNTRSVVSVQDPEHLRLGVLDSLVVFGSLSCF